MLFTLGFLLLLTPFASLQTATNQKRNSTGNDLTKSNGAFTVPKPKISTAPTKQTSRSPLNPNNINDTVLPTPPPNQKPSTIDATGSTRNKPRPAVNATAVSPTVKTSTASGTVIKKDKHMVSVNQTRLAKSTRASVVKVAKDSPGPTGALNDQSAGTRSASVNGTKTTKNKLQLAVNQTASEKSPLASNGKIAKVKPSLIAVQNVQSTSTKSASGTKTPKNKFTASVNQTLVVKSNSTGEVKNSKEKSAPTVQTPLLNLPNTSTTSTSRAVKDKAMGSDNETVDVKDLKDSKIKPTLTIQTATPEKATAANATAAVKPRTTTSSNPTVEVKSPSTDDVKNRKEKPVRTDQNVAVVSAAVKDRALASADQATVNKPGSDTKVKPAPAQPIKVVIANQCESSNTQEHEVSLKPGTPLVMTHKINLMSGGCAGGCEAEMVEMKKRLARLEREMSLLKNKCPCSVNCPNDCSGNGECQKGKCICQDGFKGPDCSNCAQGAECRKQEAKGIIKVKVDTEAQKANKERTTMEENIQERTKSVEQVQLEKNDQKKVTGDKESETKSKLAGTAKLGLAKAQSSMGSSEKRITIKGSTKTTGPTVGQMLLKHEGRKHEEARKGKTVIFGAKKTEFKLVKEGTAVKTYSKSDQIKDEPQGNITQNDITKLNRTAKFEAILTRNKATNKTLAGKHTKEQSVLIEKNPTQPSGSKQIKKVNVVPVTVHTVDGNTGKQTGTADVPSVDDRTRDTTKTGQGRYSITDVITGHTSTSVVSVDDRKSDAIKSGNGRDTATGHSVDGKSGQQGDTITLHSVDGETGQGRHTTTAHSVDSRNTDASKTRKGKDGIKVNSADAKTEQGRYTTPVQAVEDRNPDASKTGKLRSTKTLHSADGKIVQDSNTITVHYEDGKAEQGRHATTVESVDHKGEQGRQATILHYVEDRNTDVSTTGRGSDTVAQHFVDGKTGQGRDPITKHSVGGKTGQGKGTPHSAHGRTAQGRHTTTVHSVNGKAEQGRLTPTVHTTDGKTEQGRRTTSVHSVDDGNTEARKITKESDTIVHSVGGKNVQGRGTVHSIDGKTAQGRIAPAVHSVDSKIVQGRHTATAHFVDGKAAQDRQTTNVHSVDSRNTNADKTAQGRNTVAVNSVDAKTGKGKDTSTVHSIITDASKKGKGTGTLKSQYIVNASGSATSDEGRESHSQITIHGGSTTSTTRTGGLGSVKVVNISSHSFIISWSAPQGMFNNFTVIRREPQTEGNEEEDQEFEEEAFETDNVHASKNTMEVQVHKESAFSSSKVVASRSKAETKRIMLLVPGSVRSVEFSNLRSNTRYVLEIYGTTDNRRSKIHRVIATTGPEPATDMQFSNITETSLMVSWSKPKTTITGYTITYTHIVTGETHSVNLDSQKTHVVLSKLSAGSSYIITVTTTQGRVQGDGLVSIITTVPAPPTHLRAINVTDTRAVLQWTPSMGKVDRFIVSYESSKTPNVTVTVMVSGNSVEHQLRGLQRGTVYTVKVLSQKDSLQSAAITTSFTTANVVKASEVGARSALIVWRMSTVVYHSYRLTYQVVGEEAMELILEPTITEYKLTGLFPMSRYNVLVEGERDGRYTSIVTTEFITGRLRFPYPTECSQELLNGALQSGEVDIYPQGKGGQVFRVYCDMETDGGGWTVFQRRMSGKTDFYKTWSEYRAGFGNLSEEFWLGNELLHNLTSIGPVSLRVDLQSGNETAYAHYANFSIDSEENHFALVVSGYTGTAGDSMRYHNERPFSTRDKDPDSLGIHCSRAYMGGWWYKNCYKANLNGLYGTNTNNQGVVWIDWKGKDSSIPLTEMKFRPSRFSPSTHG